LPQFQRYQYVRLPALRRNMRHIRVRYMQTRKLNGGRIVIHCWWYLRTKTKRHDILISLDTKWVSMKRRISLHLLSTAIYAPPPPPPGWTIRFSFSPTLLNNELPVLLTRFYYTRYLHFRAALLLSAITSSRNKCRRRLFFPHLSRHWRTIRVIPLSPLEFSFLKIFITNC